MALPDKKVRLNIAEFNGTLFALISAFESQARVEHWTRAEINSVTDACLSESCNDPLQVLSLVCE